MDSERADRPGRLRGAVTAGIALVVFAACQAPPQSGERDQTGQSRYGGVVTVVLEDDVVDFDPLRSRGFTDRDVQYQVFDSLVRIDASGRIVPWLAERWTFSEGDRLLTFHLRPDVAYHDGTPFDAESVKWNLDRYRTGRASARTGELAAVDAVEVVDPSTVRLRLKVPFAAILATLVDRAGMMVSRRAVEAAGEDFTRRAFRAGTGPFVLTEALKDDRITIVRNPSWWGKDAAGRRLPYLDQVIFKPITSSDVRLTYLRSGNAEVANRIAGKDVASVRADPSLVYQEKPAYGFGSLVPNRAPGFVFSEGRYVKAVSMAIDRAEILERAFFGFGIVGYGAVAPPHFAFDPAFRPFERADPAGARRLVQDVGRGPLRFELAVVAGEAQNIQIALLIQAQLARAEIAVDIVQRELAALLKLQDEKQFPGMVLFGWSGRIDPDGNTYDQVRSGRPFNWSGYANAEVDRLLEEQRATTDESKRRGLLRAAEQIYVVDDPARVWYRFGFAQVLTAKKVRGMEPYPDLLVRLHTAWIEN